MKGRNTTWLHLGKCFLAWTHSWSPCSCFQLTDGSFQSFLRMKTIPTCHPANGSTGLRGPAARMEMRVRRIFLWGREKINPQTQTCFGVLKAPCCACCHSTMQSHQHTTPEPLCYCTHVSHWSQFHCTFLGEEMQVSCQNHLCAEKWREELEWFEDSLEEALLQHCFSFNFTPSWTHIPIT